MHRPASRYVTGYRRYRRQQHRRSGVRERVGGLHFEQHAAQETGGGQGCGQPDPETERGQRQSLPQDQAQQARAGIPSAMTSTARMVKAGSLRSERSAYLRSLRKVAASRVPGVSDA